MNITRPQFDACFSLAAAYGHLWAELLMMEQEHLGESIGYGSEWAIIIAAQRDRMSGGEMPDFDEVARACDLYSNHPQWIEGPCTRHETCTGRTRWRVLPDGEVQFERIGAGVIARSRVYTGRGGFRAAMVDLVGECGKRDEEGILFALCAAGASEAEALRAFEAAQTPYAKMRPVCVFDLSHLCGGAS